MVRDWNFNHPVGDFWRQHFWEDSRTSQGRPVLSCPASIPVSQFLDEKRPHHRVPCDNLLGGQMNEPDCFYWWKGDNPVQQFLPPGTQPFSQLTVVENPLMKIDSGSSCMSYDRPPFSSDYVRRQHPFVNDSLLMGSRPSCLQQDWVWIPPTTGCPFFQK